MLDPNVLIWPMLVINERIIDFGKNVETLLNLTKKRVLSVKMVEILAQCYEKLRCVHVRARRSHRNCPDAFMLEIGAEFILEESVLVTLDDSKPIR